MKRIAIALLVALFVMSSLSATSGDVVGTSTQTLVSLNLNESRATLWFTENSEGTSLGSNLVEYALDILPASNLQMKTTGNEVHGGGSKLYLNWNIISAVQVGVYLSVADVMKGEATGNKDTLGWKVSWTNGSIKTIGKIDSDTSLKTEDIAYTKSIAKYGDAGSISLSVLTENAYELKPDKYKATLTATVKVI